MENNNELDYKLLCKFCFDSLNNVLNKKNEKPKFPQSFKGFSFPLFVTWTTGKEKELRGCIGTFSNSELEKNLYNYALISAFQDDRFPPINIKELKNLNCEVSLLVNFEDTQNPFDWEIGKHGIDIDFTVNGRNYSATFLPEVAEDENWDKKTTLIYLIDKAGYNGKLENILDKIKLRKYQSIKCTISYEEYKKM